MVRPRRSTADIEKKKNLKLDNITNLSNSFPHKTQYLMRVIIITLSITVNVIKQGTYMVAPSMILIVDDGSSKTPGRVNSSSRDWNSGQVHQEDSKPNWKRSQDLQNVQ